MKAEEINRWCGLYQECLQGETPRTVEEFLSAQSLPPNPALIAELRRLFSQHYPSVLERVVKAFAAGDYAKVIRASESEVGTDTVIEIARLRLIALQRLEQDREVNALSRSLLDALAGEPFEQALINLILGKLTREDVLRIAKNPTEHCKALYFVAAGIRTRRGFEVAMETLIECVQTVGDRCVEQALAKMELEVGSGTPIAQSVPTWKSGELIDTTYHVHSTNTDGAMSVVYFATHMHWGVELALKVPRPEVLSGSDAWERLSGEANTWVKLGVHPNIVTAFYARRIDGIPVIAMEKVESGSVKDALIRGSIRDLKSILDIAVQVARGLVYASQKIPGFVHRDLKPANVLLTSDGTAKIADFGLANAFGLVAGTPAYMAPEMWVQPDSVSSAADMYSFGAMLFELLTGRRPFGQAAGGQFTVVPDSILREARLRSTVVPTEGVVSGSSESSAEFAEDISANGPAKPDPITSLMIAHLHQPPPSPARFRIDVPSDLSSFCVRLLAKDPKNRPSASEAVATLTALYESLAGHPYPRGVAETADLLAPTLNNHALSMIDLGREEDACRLLDQATETDPLDAVVAYNTGLLAWRKGRLTDSDLLDRLENITANQLDPPSISYLKALLHMERADYASALELLNEIDGSMIVGEAEISSLRCRAKEAESNARNFRIEMEAHRGKITSVRLNANGTKAISTGHDETIRFWEAGPDFRVVFVGHHESPISAMDVSADWSTAVSIDSEGVLRCWEVATGICRNTIKTDHKLLGLVRMNSYGTLCMTYHSYPLEADPVIWDIRTGDRMPSGNESNDYDYNPFLNRPLVIDGEGGRFLVRDGNVDIALVSRRSSEILQKYKGHKDTVLGIACPQEWSKFASFDATQTVRLWAIQNGRCLRTIELAEDPPTALGLSADGQRVIVGRESGKISIFNWPGLTYTAPFLLSRPLDANWLNAISNAVTQAVTQAESQIEQGDFLGAAETISLARKKQGGGRHPKLLSVWFSLYSRLEKASLQSLWKTRTFRNHDTFIQSIRLSESGEWTLSVSRDGVFCVSSIDTGEVKLTGKANLPPAWAADITQDGRIAVIALNTGGVELWDTSTGAKESVIETGTSRVLAVRIINDAHRVALGCADGSVSVHDLLSSQRTHLLEGHSHAVTAITVTSDGRYLVSASEDQTIRMWNLDTGECLSVFGDEESGPLVPADFYNIRTSAIDSRIRALTLQEADYMHRPMRLRAQRVRAICVDKQGTIALRAIGTRLELWDLRSRTLIRSVEAHEKQILALEMTPDGRFAVTAGADSRINFWNPATGERISSSLTTQEPWSVCLSQDGRFLVSGEFGQVVVWALDWSLATASPPACELMAGSSDDARSMDESAAVIALLDEFLNADGANRERLAERIVELPWNQIKSIRPILKDKIPVLVESLGSMGADDVACHAVAHLLSATGAAAVNHLRTYLQRKSTNLRKLVVVTLGRMGAVSEPAIPEMIRMLGGDREHALLATYSLFSIGPQSIPSLCAALENTDENTQRHSLFTLLRFGPMAIGAKPAITRFASSTPDTSLRREATKVLSFIGNPEAARRLPGPRSVGRSILRKVAILVFVILLGWWGLTAFSRYTKRAAANETARQNLLYAGEILQTWTKEVRIDSLPSKSPKHAMQLLDEIVISDADVQFRSEAEYIQRKMRLYEHFFAFANTIPSFDPYLRDLDSVLRNLAVTDSNSQPSLQMLKPDFLIVSMSDDDRDPEGASVSGARLDPEFISIIGDRCATSPQRLGTIIILHWSTTQIGQREAGLAGGNPLGLAARNRYRCTITAVTIPTRETAFSEEVQSSDGEQLLITTPTDGLQFRESSSTDGRSKLREIVKQKLLKLCTVGE